MGQTQYERVPQDQCPDCGHEIPFPNRRYRVNKRRLFFRCIALVLSLLLAFFIGTLSQHMRREQPNGIDIAWGMFYTNGIASISDLETHWLHV